MRRGVKQFFRFGIVGGLAFVVDYGLLIILTELFGINYLISATLAFIAAVIFNYLVSMSYVFTHKQDMSRQREFIIFVILSVIGLLINNATMYAGVEFFGIHYLITKIFATVIVAIWNFFSRKVLLDGGANGEAGRFGHQPVASGKAAEKLAAAESESQAQSQQATAEGDPQKAEA